MKASAKGLGFGELGFLIQVSSFGIYSLEFLV